MQVTVEAGILCSMLHWHISSRLNAKCSCSNLRVNMFRRSGMIAKDLHNTRCTAACAHHTCKCLYVRIQTCLCCSVAAWHSADSLGLHTACALLTACHSSCVQVHKAELPGEHCTTAMGDPGGTAGCNQLEYTANSWAHAST